MWLKIQSNTFQPHFFFSCLNICQAAPVMSLILLWKRCYTHSGIDRIWQTTRAEGLAKTTATCWHRTHTRTRTHTHTPGIDWPFLERGSSLSPKTDSASPWITALADWRPLSIRFPPFSPSLSRFPLFVCYSHRFLTAAYRFHSFLCTPLPVTLWSSHFISVQTHPWTFSVFWGVFLVVAWGERV